MWNEIIIDKTDLCPKKIGKRKRPRDFGILKRHFEPITVECATYNLNTLSVKIKNDLMRIFFGCLVTMA